MFKAELVVADSTSIARKDNKDLHSMDSHTFTTSINGPHGNLAFVGCDDVICLFRYASSSSSSSSNSQKQGLELIFRAESRQDYNSWNVGLALSDRSEDECFVAFERKYGPGFKKSSLSVFNVAGLLNMKHEKLNEIDVDDRIDSSSFVKKVSVLYDKSQGDSVFGCAFSKARPDELCSVYRNNNNSHGIFWNFKTGKTLFSQTYKMNPTFESHNPESENFTGVCYSGGDDDKYALVAESYGKTLSVIDCKTNKAVEPQHGLPTKISGCASIDGQGCDHSFVLNPNASYGKSKMFVLENEFPFRLKFEINGEDIAKAVKTNIKVLSIKTAAPHPTVKDLIAVGTLEGFLALVKKNPSSAGACKVVFALDFHKMYCRKFGLEVKEEKEKSERNKKEKKKQELEDEDEEGYDEDEDEDDDDDDDHEGGGTDKTKRCFALNWISDSSLFIVIFADYGSKAREVCVVNVFDPFQSRKIVFQISQKGNGKMSKLFSSEYAPMFLVSKYLPLSADF